MLKNGWRKKREEFRMEELQLKPSFESETHGCSLVPKKPLLVEICYWLSPSFSSELSKERDEYPEHQCPVTRFFASVTHHFHGTAAGQAAVPPLDSR